MKAIETAIRERTRRIAALQDEIKALQNTLDMLNGKEGNIRRLRRGTQIEKPNQHGN